jgi:hypothetical protein
MSRGAAALRVEQGLALALVGIALGIVLHGVALCIESHHPLPVSDQWGVVVDIDRYDRGEWRLRDLWKQHNEHRWVTPRLLFIADIVAFDGRNGLPHAATLLVQLLHAALLCQLLFAAAPSPRRRQVAFGAAVFALLFSGAQRENFESVLGFAFVFVCLAATASFVSLLRAAGRLGSGGGAGGWLAASLLAATAATYTMANGVVVWPVLLLLAVWLRLPARWVGAIAVAGALVLASYAWGYHRPTGHADPLEALRQPARVFAYLSVFTGAPFRSLGLLPAGLLGGLGVLVGAALVSRLAARGPGAAPAGGALAAAFLFSAGSALLVAVGRVSHPLEQATESRYASFALVLWASVAALIQVAWGARAPAGGWRPAALLAGLAALVVALLPQQVTAAREVARRGPVIDTAALALLVGVDDARAVAGIHPRPAKVFRLAPALRHQELSVFAGPPSPLGEPLEPRFQPDAGLRCVGEFARLEPAGAGERSGARVGGWAWDLERGAAPETVLVTDGEDRVVGLARTLFEVPEVAADLRIGTARVGWRGYARGPGPLTLRAWAVGADGRSLCALAGEQVLGGG